MAAAPHGGDLTSMIFHSDKECDPPVTCSRTVHGAGGSPSMGRIGSDIERRRGGVWTSFLNTQAVVASLVRKPRRTGRRKITGSSDRSDDRRRHSTCGIDPTVAFEQILADRTAGSGQGGVEPASRVADAVEAVQWRQRVRDPTFDRRSGTLHRSGRQPTDRCFRLRTRRDRRRCGDHPPVGGLAR